MFISNLRNLRVGMLATLTMDIPTAASVKLHSRATATSFHGQMICIRSPALDCS